MLSFLWDVRQGLKKVMLLIVLLLLFLGYAAPLQLPVVAYKLTLAGLAALSGYFLDRILFPFAGPESYLCDDWKNSPNAERQDDADFPVAPAYEVIFCAAMLRQVMLVVGMLIAVSLGL